MNRNRFNFQNSSPYYAMDPLYVESLIAEVRYLHSLWHQGPPRPTPCQLTVSNPSPTRRLHHPSNATQFKKKGKIKRQFDGKNNRQSEEKNPAQPLSPASGKEWPCNASSSDPPPTTADWNKAWPEVKSEPLLLSPQEKANLAANQAQSMALKVTKDYFLTSDDDDGDFMDEDNECEEDGFFVKLFAEDNELREYYNETYLNGEFVCLVCGGLGKKLAGKKFKGCIALVQHTISIVKTQKKRAHRAYGQAICETLGWEIDNLSSMVSALAEDSKLDLNDADQGQAETFKCTGPAPVGERDQNGLVAHESKEDSVGANNLVEGETQAIVDEGDEDGSAVPAPKEGSTDVTISCQGEEVSDAKGKVEANIGGGTKDNPTNLERKEEATVDACNGGALTVKESFGGENSESNGGSTSFGQNSGIDAAGSKAAGNFDFPVPVVGSERNLLKMDALQVMKARFTS